MCVLCACYVRAMCVLCACYVRAMCVPCACYVRALLGHVCAMCLRCACYVPAMCVLCACYYNTRQRYKTILSWLGSRWDNCWPIEFVGVAGNWQSCTKCEIIEIQTKSRFPHFIIFVARSEFQTFQPPDSNFDF